MLHLDKLTKQPYIILEYQQRSQFSSPISESSPIQNLNSLSPDEYIRKMINLKLMDPETYKLTEEALNKPLPELGEGSLKIIQNILAESIPLERNGLAQKQGVTNLQLRTAIGPSLDALMNSGQFDEASIVGSSVPFLLGLSFFEKWCNTMIGSFEGCFSSEFSKKMLRCPSDIDVRLKVKKSSKKLSDLKARIPGILQKAITTSNCPQDFVNYLQRFDPKKYQNTDSGTGNLLREVLEEGYLLKYSHINDGNNQFVIATLGNSDFALELIAVESLERNYLFTRDDLTLSFKDSNDLYKIELKSESSPHQAISDLLGGIIRPHPKVTGKDWIAQVHLMILGNRMVEKGTEKNLYKALTKGEKPPCQEIIDEMNKRLSVHNAKNDTAAIAAAFQLCTSMNFFGAEQSDIGTVWKGITSNRTPPKEGLLLQIFSALRENIAFNEVLECVEVGSLIARGKDGSVIMSFHEGPAIRIYLSGTPYSLWHRFDPKNALLAMAKRKSIRPELQAVLATFYDWSFNSSPPLEREQVPIECIAETKEMLIKKQDPYLAELGVALHRLSQTFSLTPFPDLLRKIPSLIFQMPSTQHRIRLWTQLSNSKIASERVFENLLPLIKSPQIDKEHFLQEWIVSIALEDDSALCNSAIVLGCEIKTEKGLITLIEKLFPYPKFLIELLRKHPSIASSLRVKTLNQICGSIKGFEYLFPITEILSDLKGKDLPEKNSLSGFLTFTESLESKERYAFVLSLHQKGLTDKDILTQKIKEWIPSILKTEKTIQDSIIPLICETLSEKDIFSHIKKFATEDTSFAIRLLSKAEGISKSNRMKLTGLILLKAAKIEEIDLIFSLLENQSSWVLIEEKEQQLITQGFLQFLDQLSNSDHPVKQFETLCSLTHKGLIHKETYFDKSKQTVQYCILNERPNLLHVYQLIEKEFPYESCDLDLEENEWIEILNHFYNSNNPEAFLIADSITPKIITSQNPKALPIIKTFLNRELTITNPKIQDYIHSSPLTLDERAALQMRLIKEGLKDRTIAKTILSISEIDITKLSKNTLTEFQKVLLQLFEKSGKTKEFTSFWEKNHLPILESLKAHDLYQEAFDLIYLFCDYPLKYSQKGLLEILLRAVDLNKRKELLEKKILPFDLSKDAIPDYVEMGIKLIQEQQLPLAEKIEKKLPKECKPVTFLYSLVEKEMNEQKFEVCAELVLKWELDSFPYLDNLVIQLSKTNTNIKLAVRMIKFFNITKRNVLERIISSMNEKSDKKSIREIYQYLMDQKKYLITFENDLEISFEALFDLVQKCETAESRLSLELYNCEDFKAFQKHPPLKMCASSVIFRILQKEKIGEKKKLIHQYLDLTKGLPSELKNPFEIYYQNVRILTLISDIPSSEISHFEIHLNRNLTEALDWFKKNSSSLPLELIGPFASELTELLIRLSSSNSFAENKEECFISAVDILSAEELFNHLKLETYIKLTQRILKTRRPHSGAIDLYLLKRLPLKVLISHGGLSNELIRDYIVCFARIYCTFGSDVSPIKIQKANQIYSDLTELFNEYEETYPHIRKIKKDSTIFGEWFLSVVNEMPFTNGSINILNLCVKEYICALTVGENPKRLLAYQKILLNTILKFRIDDVLAVELVQAICWSKIFDEERKYETQVALQPKQFSKFFTVDLTAKDKQKVVTEVLQRLLIEMPTIPLLLNIKEIIENAIQVGLYKTPEEAFSPSTQLNEKFIKLIQFAISKTSNYDVKTTLVWTLYQIIFFQDKSTSKLVILGEGKKDSSDLVLELAKAFYILFEENKKWFPTSDESTFVAQKSLFILSQGLSRGILKDKNETIKRYIHDFMAFDFSSFVGQEQCDQMFADEITRFLILSQEPCLTAGDLKNYLKHLKKPSTGFIYIFRGVVSHFNYIISKNNDNFKLLETGLELLNYAKANQLFYDCPFNFLLCTKLQFEFFFKIAALEHGYLLTSQDLLTGELAMFKDTCNKSPTPRLAYLANGYEQVLSFLLNPPGILNKEDQGLQVTLLQSLLDNRCAITEGMKISQENQNRIKSYLRDQEHLK